MLRPKIKTTKGHQIRWSFTLPKLVSETIRTAMLDRLLHHAQVVSLKANSYRMIERLRVGTVGFE